MTKDLFDFAVEAEGVEFQLEDIQNLIALFWDNFSAETENIDPTEPSTTKLFLARLPMLNSLLTAIGAALANADKELRATIEKAYNAAKSGKNEASADTGLVQESLNK